ncbi:hypothetical protein C7S14_8086 [Burkholderia cepacia]|nr:hypothetical protein C7S14_8086 [Burkholderia cepacia]
MNSPFNTGTSGFVGPYVPYVPIHVGRISSSPCRHFPRGRPEFD